MIILRIERLVRFSKALKDCRRAVRKESAYALQAGAEAVQTTVRSDLATGRGQGDEARQPRSRSGRLAASVEIRSEASGLRAVIGSGLNYGRFLEFGTRAMAPRPWLAPALMENRKIIRARLCAAVNRALAQK